MFENDYTFYGKHATYLKYLAVKNASENPSEDASSSARIFERYIDVYMNAAIWGLLYGRTAEKDNSTDDRARIYADAFVREQHDCVFLYRLVLLLDKTSDISSTERVDRAFRYDSQKEKKKEFNDNMELFHSYVRGGIEEMYEQFTDGCTNREDYVTKIFEIVSSFKEELEGISFEEELNKLLK